MAPLAFTSWDVGRAARLWQMCHLHKRVFLHIVTMLYTWLFGVDHHGEPILLLALVMKRRWESSWVGDTVAMIIGFHDTYEMGRDTDFVCGSDSQHHRGILCTLRQPYFIGWGHRTPLPQRSRYHIQAVSTLATAHMYERMWIWTWYVLPRFFKSF